MEECAYLDERLPRFDSSNIHSWFPVSQRLQRIPALGSQRIFKRRQTVQALCVVCVNGGVRALTHNFAEYRRTEPLLWISV